MEKNEIWAGFGPAGNTDKKIWTIKYAIFEGVFLSFGLKKYYGLLTKKLHKMKVQKTKKFSYKF